MKLRTSQTNLQSPYRNLSGYGYELEVPKDTLDNRILFILDEILNNFQV
jgi:hypothetical protein